MKQSTSTAARVLEGLFEWTRDNQWFLADKVGPPDPALELAAQRALLELAAGNVDAYRANPADVRQLASTLLIDFLAKLTAPLSEVTWPVSPGDGSRGALQRAAWAAIALELRRSQRPGPTVR